MVASKQSLKIHVKWVTVIASVLIILEIINFLTNRSLNTLSIYPRHYDSLPFIFTAPFLHGSFSHFVSNFFTLCIFAFLLMQYGVKRFTVVSIGIIVITGLLVWCFGRTAFHLGASGVVYGYFGYLLLAGLLSRKFSLMVISLLIGIMYGGIIWGILPMLPGVSWESHLFGFLSGLLLAYIFRKKT